MAIVMPNGTQNLNQNTFATTMKAVASKLLAFYGNQVTVVRTTPQGFNTSDGSVQTAETLIYTGYGNSSTYNVYEVNNVTVFATDIKFSFASDMKPVVGDVVTTGGIDMRVMKVDTDNAQDADILYTLQLRV